MPRQTERYTQRPSPRVAQGQAQRKSEADLQEKRRRSAAQRRERQMREREEARRRALIRKQRRARLFRHSLAAGLAFTVLYWCFVGFSIAGRPDGNEEALPVLLFTQGERKEDAKMAAEEVNFAGKVYLPVTFLERYMAISQFGDYQTRSFLICESGEYATFYLGSQGAIINGERVCLKEDVFVKDDVLYLPVDFFTDKMNCFTFEESAPLAANVLTFRQDLEPGMQFHPQTESAPVDFATVPVAPALPTE